MKLMLFFFYPTIIDTEIDTETEVHVQVGSQSIPPVIEQDVIVFEVLS